MGFSQKTSYIEQDFGKVQQRNSSWDSLLFKNNQADFFTLVEDCEQTKKDLLRIMTTGQHVDFNATLRELDAHDVKGGVRYVLSNVTPEPKVSLGYYNCLALVGAGIGNDEHPLSFLGHIDTKILYKKNALGRSTLPTIDPLWKEGREALRDDMTEVLCKFAGHVKRYKDFAITIHAGNDVPRNDVPLYEDAVEVLQKMVKRIIGCWPTVGSPKAYAIEGGPSHVMIDTPNQLIHILRDSRVALHDIASLLRPLGEKVSQKLTLSK